MQSSFLVIKLAIFYSVFTIDSLKNNSVLASSLTKKELEKILRSLETDEHLYMSSVKKHKSGATGEGIEKIALKPDFVSQWSKSSLFKSNSPLSQSFNKSKRGSNHQCENNDPDHLETMLSHFESEHRKSEIERHKTKLLPFFIEGGNNYYYNLISRELNRYMDQYLLFYLSSFFISHFVFSIFSAI